MYRDDESAAAEHAAELDEKLEASLRPLVRRAATLRVRKWHALLPLVIVGPMVFLVPDIANGYSFLSTGFWHTFGASHQGVWGPLVLALVATSVVFFLFVGAMHLAARARVGRLRRTFPSPPRNVRSTE